jgi:hypothetical protein
LKLILLIGIIFCSQWVWSQTPSPVTGLSSTDLKIFNETVGKCRGGSWSSALALSFDLENLNSSVGSSLKILSSQMYSELNLRVQNRGLSARVFEIRNSPGFWLALTECYGYQYGELNRGNLIKQIIDLGHLTTEGLGIFAGLGVARAGVAVWSAAMKKYPLAVSFVATGMTSLVLSNLIRELYYSHPVSMTPQDKKEYQQLEAQLFYDANAAIAETVERSKQRIQFLENRLSDPQLSQTERSKIISQMTAIKNSLAKLYQLNPQLKQS